MSGTDVRGGVVSITFRALEPAEVVTLAVRAGLEGIEWGGDIHVPHGDEARARDVAALTRDAGLRSCAYGSYYRLGASEDEGLSFERVLASARCLDAPVIRVWAGRGGSAEMTPASRAAVAADGLRVADLAAREKRTIALEYHSGTLTDTAESVATLMRELTHPAIRFMWQPASNRPTECHLPELRQVLPRLANLHVYQWARHGTGVLRHSLADGAAVWPRYLAEARGDSAPHWALLEFVRDDSPDQFLNDAATLRSWLSPMPRL
jgi:3-dehydroshikimate dehydratase